MAVKIRVNPALSLAIAALVSIASAQTIQKWKTSDGKLYFGDRPPAGSTKIGEEGSNEPPSSGSQESAPRSAEQEKLSIDVSRERTEIEKALNDDAERLEEVDKQIAEVQRAPNVVPPWMERRAGFKNETADTLRELTSQKRAALATIADLWKRFDKLDTKVKKAYEGKTPDWWRSRLSCPKCPTRSEERTRYDEAGRRLVEELKSHYDTQDAATLDRIECDVLTIGDLRKLADVLDLRTAITEGGKHDVVAREDARDEPPPGDAGEEAGREIAALLGHSSPVVMLRVYSHWFKRVKTVGTEDAAAAVFGGRAL